VLTTATGVTLSGDNSVNLIAIRSSDGTTLWHENIGRVQGAPITYLLDGKQYLVVSGGSSLYAYALP
jgi:alcohol dehydrogenase (cytochrome c)